MLAQTHTHHSSRAVTPHPLPLQYHHSLVFWWQLRQLATGLDHLPWVLHLSFKKNQHALMHMSVSIYTQKEKSLRIFTKMLTHYLVGKSGEDFFKNFFWFISIFQFFYSKHGLHELLKIPT